MGKPGKEKNSIGPSSRGRGHSRGGPRIRGAYRGRGAAGRGRGGMSNGAAGGREGEGDQVDMEPVQIVERRKWSNHDDEGQ